MLLVPATVATHSIARAKSLPTGLHFTTTDAPSTPLPSRTWYHGQAAIIRWEPPTAVSEIRILLFRASSPTFCAIVADHVENNGLFVLPRVPHTFPPRDDYVLRILSVDGHTDSTCFAIRA
ncbi:Aste57867_12259 [Aphanomyces stellatus]|uniref:Aste57867_12259 protein n=1 Tax=Aphanomyces stellatus TaxID=120398 RepID=A0A485KVJ5_9STRA|nr:hypothetical protein As57867_012214 [Aphanomyces stellatus]VFT89112.1 Aste57867_12259 [Aphanomyces stellatus]